MKLQDINLLSSKEFEFLDPITNKSFEPPVTFTILSGESKEAKGNFLKAQRAIFEKMQDKGNLDEDGKIKTEIIEEANKVYLSSLIVSWTNIEDFKKVTDEAKLKLMENDFISRFVIDKSSNLGNFKAV